MIFSVARIVNYYWDHESMYGKTIECGRMICEREMSSAGGGKQLKKVMSECLWFFATIATATHQVAFISGHVCSILLTYKFLDQH